LNLTIHTTTDLKDPANFLAESILQQLKLGKKVFWFVTGGSSVAVCVKVAEILRESSNQNLLKNLTVTLTDERYGTVGHSDSNWQQLLEKGFNLPEAQLLPVLIGEDRAVTTEKFNAILNQEFTTDKENKYTIGLFGIGKDGHTAGILPESSAVDSPDLAFSYDTPTFSRITITPKTIVKLDAIMVWAQGAEKWKIVKDLLEKEIEINKQPAQILKKVPLLTIFTDYKKE
jgi:6-phosphogluconolactonase/glucosamine-6-phosphate isomerase/deaminase